MDSLGWLFTSDLDVELSRLGRQGSLVQVIKVRVKQGLLGGDPLGRVVDEHLLQEIQARWLNLLHAVLQGHGLPVGEGLLRIELMRNISIKTMKLT